MQKLGQHFLKNDAILKKIVATLALAEGDRVIEIGPGHGELTVPLLRAADEIDCAITSIEKDRTLTPDLMALSEKEAPGRLSIIEGDALKQLPEVIAQILQGPQSLHYKIVGNIPYYITGKLLRVISELEHKPERVVLLIQKEVAERICAVPPTMNRLAASVQFWANATIVARVPRGDFSPPPDVDSAVIVLEKIHGKLGGAARDDVDPTLYYKAVREIFAQPRKTLLNNIVSSAGGAAVKGDITSRLQEIGIDPGARPQDLDIRAIIAIAGMNLWA